MPKAIEGGFKPIYGKSLFLVFRIFQAFIASDNHPEIAMYIQVAADCSIVFSRDIDLTSRGKKCNFIKTQCMNRQTTRDNESQLRYHAMPALMTS